MRLWAVACVAITVGALGGCHKKAAEAAASDAAAADAPLAGSVDDPGFLGLGSKHGRYAAVGIYQPSEGWAKMVIDQLAAAPEAAGRLPDQAVIVVTDSQTGEVRACGDMTGYCVGMNPWKTTLAGAQIAPIRLKAPNTSPINDTASASSAAPSSR